MFSSWALHKNKFILKKKKKRTNLSYCEPPPACISFFVHTTNTSLDCSFQPWSWPPLDKRANKALCQINLYLIFMLILSFIRPPPPHSFYSYLTYKNKKGGSDNLFIKTSYPSISRDVCGWLYCLYLHVQYADNVKDYWSSMFYGGGVLVTEDAAPYIKLYISSNLLLCM